MPRESRAAYEARVGKATPVRVAASAAHRGVTGATPKIQAALDTAADRMGLPRDAPWSQVIGELGKRLGAQDADDAAYEAQLVAASRAGTDLAPPRRGAPAKHVLDWASATGRIAAASRSAWERFYESDPATTEAQVRVLAPSAPVAVAAAASSTSYRVQTASGLDVSPLPPRMRLAAARCADAGQVATLLQEFGGKTDSEAGPEWLKLCGYEDIAAQVAIDDQAAHVAATAAWNASVTDDQVYEGLYGGDNAPEAVAASRSANFSPPGY